MAGLLHLVDKPEGWTSHDVVARLRRLLAERRMGHAGTLDPFATGLLLVAEGRATLLLGCLGLLPKRYSARVRFGTATDTQDRTGTVVRVSERMPEEAAVEAALARFRGDILQQPPLYSAVRVAGTRLHRAARRGESFPREARSVRVHELRLVTWEPPVAVLDMTVSRGTYVRAIAEDLGASLDSAAHVAELRRVASGPFRVEDALSLAASQDVAAETFRARALAPERALSFLPRVKLTAEEARRLRHGAAPPFEPGRLEPPDVSWPLPPGVAGWPLALLGPGGSVAAVAAPEESQEEGAPLALLRVLEAA